MKVLAIETSTLTGSVALLDSDPQRLLGEITLSVSIQHAERLMPAIQRLLQDTEDIYPTPNPSPYKREGRSRRTPSFVRRGLGEVDLLAVSIGPGSFTGLRIGIAAVQGLSLAAGRPVIGVSTLEALAMNALPFEGLIVPLLDARRGEIYAGIYRPRSDDPESLELVEKEKAISPEKFVEELLGVAEREQAPFLLIGSGGLTYRSLFLKSLGERARFLPPPLNDPRASQVGFVGWKRYRTREGCRSQDLEVPLPRYLRPASVTFPIPATAPLSSLTAEER